MDRVTRYYINQDGDVPLYVDVEASANGSGDYIHSSMRWCEDADVAALERELEWARVLEQVHTSFNIGVGRHDSHSNDEIRVGPWRVQQYGIEGNCNGETIATWDGLLWNDCPQDLRVVIVEAVKRDRELYPVREKNKEALK